MRLNNRILFCLILIFILLFCSACSNSIFNQLIHSDLSDEQKTPDYAIKQHLKINDGDYKYVVLGNYLFVQTGRENLTAYKTDKGNYTFDYPFYNNRSMFLVQKGQFLSTIGMADVNNQFEIDISVLHVNGEAINKQPYSIGDSTGEEFTFLQYSEGASIWWIKVMDSIPDDYKVYIESEGTIYEILNKETIDKKIW